MYEQVMQEAALIIADRWKRSVEQGFQLIERYKDVIDVAYIEGVTDPRHIARIVNDELRAEAQFLEYNEAGGVAA